MSGGSGAGGVDVSGGRGAGSLGVSGGVSGPGVRERAEKVNSGC